jgi:flagellar motor switch protein FliN/FliY
MSITITVQEAAAERLAQHLPASSLLTVAGIVPAESAAAHASPAVTATFVGASTTDFALLLVDTSFLAAAGGASTGAPFSASDVLRPALEQAASAFDAGVLGELREEDATGLLQDPATVVFELHDGTVPFGWFAVRVRNNDSGPSRNGRDSDLTARLGLISSVEMALTVEIGRTRMSVRDALALEPGKVIELDRSAGAPADVLLNGRLIAHGEVVVVDQDYAVRITRVLDGAEGTL